MNGKMHIKRMINYVVSKDDLNTAGDLINRAIFNHLTTVSFIIEYINCTIYLLGNYVLSSPVELKKAERFAGLSFFTEHFKLLSWMSPCDLYSNLKWS